MIRRTKQPGFGREASYVTQVPSSVIPGLLWVLSAAALLGGACAGAGVGVWWGRRGLHQAAAESPDDHAEATARLDRRLAEVNRMTGGLAHEIKNPLSTIGLNVQLLGEDLGEIRRKRSETEPPGDATEDDEALERVQRRLEGVRRETGRLRDILDDFLRFAGRIRLDLQPIDLDAVVEELTDFFLPEAESKGVRLRTELAAGTRPVVADAGLLKQALLNLLMNAVQALAADRGGVRPADRGAPKPSGPTVRGELVVRSRESRDSSGRELVAVEVRDTGPGVPADALERIFEPYHTTRRGGTGLGLPTSRRIVELHGGTLRVQSEAGRGTQFTIELPREGPPPREGTGQTGSSEK